MFTKYIYCLITKYGIDRKKARKIYSILKSNDYDFSSIRQLAEIGIPCIREKNGNNDYVFETYDSIIRGLDTYYNFLISIKLWKHQQ